MFEVLFLFEKIEDHGTLTAFYASCGLEVSDDINKDGAFFSVAETENGNFIAAATLSKRNGVFILDYIAVDPKHRKSGLGRQVFDIIKQHAESEGAEYLYITTKAPPFFEKLGFTYGEPENFDLNADCKGCPQLGNGCDPKNMKLTFD